MSSARIAKLEVLLSRIGTRRGQPRLAVVTDAAVLAPAPVLAQVAPAAPGAPMVPAAPVAAMVPAAPAAAEAPMVPAAPVAAAFLGSVDPLSHDLSPALAFASEPEPPSEPTLSIELDSEPDPELTAAPLDELGVESAYGAALSPPTETDHTISLAPEPEPTPEPERVTPAPAVFQRAEPGIPAPHAPVTFSMAPAPVSASMSPPRMSLPSRPSIPSQDIVPDGLPFTLMSDHPAAAPAAQESIEFATIALSSGHTPVIDISGAAPLRVELQPASPGVINFAPDAPGAIGGYPSAASAVTVVPGRPNHPGLEFEGVSLRGALAVPPPPVPATDAPELEPEAHGAAGRPELIAASPLAADAVVVSSTSALAARRALNFGALLERSLALRPRSDS